MGRRGRGLPTIIVLVTAFGTTDALARPFVPGGLSTARYATGPVEKVDLPLDGGSVHVEVARPVAAPGGPQPPARVPVVLQMSPYTANLHRADPSVQRYEAWRELLTRHGYAVAVADIAGYSGSTGCPDFFGPREISSAARAVRHLGTEARWSNGRVGMLGLSYDGAIQLALAASGRPELASLKVVVPVGAAGSMWEGAGGLDGVELTGAGAIGLGVYFPISPVPDEDAPTSALRGECVSEHAPAMADHASGDLGHFWQARDFRAKAQSIEAAVLQVHGFNDMAVGALGPVGMFNRLRGDRHRLVLGQWNHAYPDAATFVPDWRRTDFEAMVLAWFDRWLLGLPVRTEEWPRVQVQDSLGRWRAEREWPAAGDSVGQLALAARALGSREPQGRSHYDETSRTDSGAAVFTTPAVKAPLHLTGQPVADLWLVLEQPDAHVTASLQVLDAQGAPVRHALAYGTRSARHLEPIVDGHQRQAEGRPAPVRRAVRVPVRFQMMDLVVPAGGRLQLSLAGQYVQPGAAAEGSAPPLTSLPSGATGRVVVLHECLYPSTLRFRMPAARPEGIEVPMAGTAPAMPARLEADGGGLARAPVCDRRALDPQGVAAMKVGRSGPLATAAPALRVTISPRRAVAGRRTRFRVVVSSAGDAVRGARVAFAGRTGRTGPDGRATFAMTLRRAGRPFVVARSADARSARTRVTVRR